MNQGLSRNMRRAARRMRRKRTTELNIVSMIDILTVLVFFLLVNALGVSVLGVNLPPPNTEPPKEPPLDLRLIVRKDDLVLLDREGIIQKLPNTVAGPATNAAASPPANAGAGAAATPAPGPSYDLASLADLIGKIKDRFPDEDKITLMLEPEIAYDALVQVMDVVRMDPGGNGKPQRELFPQISMGDAPAQPAPQAATQ
jgi:biopolymer transport protein ExbD